MLYPSETSRLPPAVRWEYEVIAVTELGGTATADGTAIRMAGMMNHMAEKGWELVTAIARDARYAGKQSVLLTFRREITTAEMFQERAFVEERLRREVLSLLEDAGD